MGLYFPIACRSRRLTTAITRALLTGLFALCWLALTDRAQAQVNQYTNSTAGVINDSTCGGAVLNRDFIVAPSYTINDVNIGILLTHSYRSDLRITLRSPTGTTINVMLNTAGDGDNVNDLFDDEAATAIAGHNATVTDPTTPAPPPYSHSHRPTAALTAFDGQNSAGTWTLSICDSVAQDVGNFARADLYLSQVPSTYADLSLTKTVSDAAPIFGAAISYTLTITNAAAPSLTANGVTVQDMLPAGFTYISHTAGGGSSFTPGTGVWNVGTLVPGGLRTLIINGTVSASPGAVVTNSAEVSASSISDLDSVPNNGSLTEDDDAQTGFTVAGVRVAGTPPTLICPAGSLLHDWDSVTWTAGSLDNSYTVTNLGSINFAIAISGGVFLNNAGFGGLSPALQTQVTGALVPVQRSLAQLVNMTSQMDVVTTVVTLPNGVAGAQFRIFDLDFGASQFADKVTVTGSFAGSPVTPTLTNGVVNYVIGNSGFGDGVSADASANGNLVVSFTGPVDSITITYGNHAAAPGDPGQQAIAIHDFTFCRPVANLSVAKSSAIISDPQNGTTNPKAIPGAVMRYCIVITNPDSGTASNIIVGDNIPAGTTFVPASIRSGAACATAATLEDDDNSGADESDPNGASVSGAVLTGTATTIGPNSTRAFTFQATVN